jgi:uncharacterized protein YwqG
MNKEQAVDLIRGSELYEQADILIDYLLPSARIVVHDDSREGVEDSASSYFGGLPCLTQDAVWPLWDKGEYLNAQIAHLEARFRENPQATGLRDIALQMRQELSRGPVPLLFLGQLALNEIHAVAPLRGWPREGTLSFFYEPSAWGFDPLARGHCRILYYPAHTELASVPFPTDLVDEARFPRRNFSFVHEWTLPTRIKKDEVDLSIWGSDEYHALCRQVMSSQSDDEPIHRCGGHPQEIQGDMRLECQLVTNGLYCGDSSGYQDPRRSLLEKGAADWDLILQVDSDEKRLGWMWGDLGRIYFWARWQDIEAADFGSSWAILQCY